METNPNNQKSSLNEYHKQRSIEAQKAVEEMAEIPYTIEQMREQKQRLDNSIRNSMIDHIVKYLTKHEHILETYSWKEFDVSGLNQLKLFSKNDYDFFIDKKITQFDKTLKLKEILSVVLQDTYKKDKVKFEEIALWLIKNWGGIKSGNNTELIKLIYESIECFNNNKNITFRRISSKSKVLCFMYPDSNIIYDSRVAYSLNWIFLQNSFVFQKYFPIPESQSSKLNAFNMKTLIRIINIRKYLGNIGHIERISKRDKDFFISDNIAYNEMNTLLKEVNQKLWNKNPERKGDQFFVQMLLFTLADNIIFKEMKTKIRIKISD